MAKGGGAWKVAYADFVTAMMAFFLVMWIVGQDHDKKEAITRYFNNPLGFKPIKVSKTPDHKGSLFSRYKSGDVTAAEEVAMGTGRKSYSSENEPSPSTKLIGDHLFKDDEALQQLAHHAKQEIEAAKKSHPNNAQEAESSALNRVSSKLRANVLRQLPDDMPSLYRDLIYEALNSVNWNELAEDVMYNVDHN